MARKPRIHLSGGLYHVIFRGNGGQAVFLNDEDRYRFQLLLQEGACRFGYHVHAFCLMTNHIHLALQVSEIPLSRSMQNLSFRFTRWINWRQKRTGHLFQGRYKAVLVDGDSYLLELIRYIHLNPVRAGIVKDPVDYPWSSHRAYLGKETLPCLTIDSLLIHFGNKLEDARQNYQGFVLDRLGEERRPEFHGAGVDSRLLGDVNFLEKCLSDSEKVPIRLALQIIVDTVCRNYEISETESKSPSQCRKVSETRAVVGWFAQKFGCVTLSEVGAFVNRDIGSISSAVRRLSNRMQEVPELAERVRLIEVELRQLVILEA